MAKFLINFPVSSREEETREISVGITLLILEYNLVKSRDEFLKASSEVLILFVGISEGVPERSSNIECCCMCAGTTIGNSQRLLTYAPFQQSRDLF